MSDSKKMIGKSATKQELSSFVTALCIANGSQTWYQDFLMGVNPKSSNEPEELLQCLVEMCLI